MELEQMGVEGDWIWTLLKHVTIMVIGCCWRCSRTIIQALHAW